MIVDEIEINIIPELIIEPDYDIHEELTDECD